MNLYEIRFDDGSGDVHSLFVGSQKEAARERKQIRQDRGDIIGTFRCDIPIKKRALIAWLNDYVDY